MNTKPKSKTAAPKQRSVGLSHKARWITYATVFVVLTAFAAIITANIYNKNTIEKEHAEVARQLNEVATDLHKVYVNLKTKLPNVVESSFRNECAMSYSGPASKTYSCGPMLRIYAQDTIGNNVDKLRESAVLQTGVFKSYLNIRSGQSSDDYEYSDYQFMHSNGQKCKVSSIIYRTKNALQKDTSASGDGWTLPIEADDIYCSKNLTYPVGLEGSWSQ